MKISLRISPARFAAALAVACLADAASIWAEAVLPIEWGLDLATAFLLFLILGRRWQLLPAIVAEAIPGVAAFPSWVLVVLAISLVKTEPVRRD